MPTTKEPNTVVKKKRYVRKKTVLQTSSNGEQYVAVVEQNPSKYTCNFCNHSFTRKTFYETHLTICEQLDGYRQIKPETREEENKVMPTQQEMYVLIQNLIRKTTSMEEELHKLRKYAEITKQQINILDWLQENAKPETDLITTIKQYTVTEKELKVIFDNDYIFGMTSILENIFSTDINTSHSLRAFTQKPHTFYMYQDNEWRIMDETDLSYILMILSQKTLRLFFQWKEKHNKEIEEDEDFYTEYILNHRKVMGSNKPKEQNYHTIKSKLYNYLKVSIKDIVKYEFAF